MSYLESVYLITQPPGSAIVDTAPWSGTMSWKRGWRVLSGISSHTVLSISCHVSFSSSMMKSICVWGSRVFGTPWCRRKPWRGRVCHPVCPPARTWTSSRTPCRRCRGGRWPPVQARSLRWSPLMLSCKWRWWTGAACPTYSWWPLHLGTAGACDGDGRRMKMVEWPGGQHWRRHPLPPCPPVPCIDRRGWSAGSSWSSRGARIQSSLTCPPLTAAGVCRRTAASYRSASWDGSNRTPSPSPYAHHLAS